MAGDQERRVCEEVVHLFEGQLGGLREEEVEGEGVGEIADDEQEVVPVPDVGYCGIYLDG